MNLRTECGERIQRRLTELGVNEKSINEVFYLVINPLTTFIDFSLIEHLISKFGDDSLKKSMESYVQKVMKFVDDTTVDILIKTNYWPGMKDRRDLMDLSELEIHFGKDASKCTLKEVEHCRKNLFGDYQSGEFVSILINLKASGSFIATLLIPSILISEFMTLVSHFFDQSVISISVNGQLVHPMSSQQILKVCLLIVII